MSERVRLCRVLWDRQPRRVAFLLELNTIKNKRRTCGSERTRGDSMVVCGVHRVGPQRSPPRWVAARRLGDERRPSWPGQSDTQAGGGRRQDPRPAPSCRLRADAVIGILSHFGRSACHGFLNRALQQETNTKETTFWTLPPGQADGPGGPSQAGT